MTNTYSEPARETPIAYEPDVIVTGGGVSGCAAAISAARNGAKTLLIERNGVLGGVATAGLMANIGNQFMTHENFPVIRGVPREIVERLVREGGTKPDWHRPEQPGVVFDPEIFKLVLIEILREAGVEILLHALAVDAIMEGSRIAGVILESKSGRQVSMTKYVIDTTGDADIAHLAGAPYQTVAHGGSMLFRLGNVDLDRAVRWIGEHRDSFPNETDGVKDYDTFARNWDEYGFFFFPHHGGKKFKPWDDAIERGEYAEKDGDWYGLNAFGMYGIRGDRTVVVNSNHLWVDDVDVRQLTRAELEGRRICHKNAEFLRAHLPGFEEASVIDTAEDWGQRRSRVIDAHKTLTKHDAAGACEWDDTIGRAPRNLLPKGFAIPLGIMQPKEVDGLLVASGKNVSTDPVGLIRGMATCMVLGEAAGVAAALSSRTGSFAPIEQIQRQLSEQGVFLG